jgi:hypothetical protein
MKEELSQCAVLLTLTLIVLIILTMFDSQNAKYILELIFN